MNGLANLHVTVLGSLAVFDRIFPWIDAEPEVSDSPNARDLEEPQGQVTFENVSFEYEAGSPVLDDLSLKSVPDRWPRSSDRAARARLRLHTSP